MANPQSDYPVSDLDTSINSDPPSMTLSGQSAGVQASVSGRLRVVTGPAELAGFSEGEILVAHEYQPGWRAQLVMARGLILESAELPAQLLQMSLELDLPVLVGVNGATEKLQTGMIIYCSAEGGVAQLAERRDPASSMRQAVPAARAARLRVEVGPGHFAAPVGLSVVDGKAATDREADNADDTP